MYAMSLCLLLREHEVLLARKKKRTFGYGTWNGYGGKLEAGESVEEAALRELLQEGGVVARSQHLQHVATIDFSFEQDPEWDQTVYVYTLRQWEGDPSDSGEMANAQWFPFAAVPYDAMWPADRYWLRLVLQGKKVRGYCRFTNIVDKKIVDAVFAPVSYLAEPTARR